MPETPALTRLLDLVDQAAARDNVSVQDVLDRIGDRSFMPVVLVIALVLVSPLSGIPGFSSLSAIVVLLVMGQALLRRDHLWLPRVLRDRQVRSDRLHKAVTWLRKPAAWMDRHSRPRLLVLTSGPLRWLTLALCMVVPMSWPFLELIPFSTTIGASALALMTFGLLTRDGIYVLGGYGVIGCIIAAFAWLFQVAT